MGFGASEVSRTSSPGRCASASRKRLTTKHHIRTADYQPQAPSNGRLLHTYGENALEPEQFLHEALGFIAFIVPALLVIVAAVIALTIAGFIWFIAAVAHENRADRKKFEERKANRAKLDRANKWGRN